MPPTPALQKKKTNTRIYDVAVPNFFFSHYIHSLHFIGAGLEPEWSSSPLAVCVYIFLGMQTHNDDYTVVSEDFSPKLFWDC